jgi:hypothetical protein
MRIYRHRLKQSKRILEIMADEEVNEGAEATPADAGAPATPEEAPTDTPTPEAAEADTGWRDTIEDGDTRKLADRYTSPAAMAKALRDANVELSGRVKIPGEDASDEDMSRYRKQLGVPETPGDYKLSVPEHMPQEIFQSDEVQGRMNQFTEAMHKAGAPSDVVDAAFGWYWAQEADAVAAQAKTDKDYSEAAEGQLRKEWGADYDGNLNIANKYIEQTGSSDLLHMELKDGSLLASNPAFLKLVAEAGRQNTESRAQMGLYGQEAGADAQKQYDELTEQIYTAHSSGDSAKAQRLDTERSELSKVLFGDRPVPGRAA